MSRRDFSLVIALAFALRWAAIFELAGSDLALVPLGDARGYVDWARGIAAGDWMGSEVFYQAPLYPYLLALCFRVAGDGFLLPRLLQATAGALACGWIGKWTTPMAGVSAGRAAGVLAAVYAPWIWTDGLLQKTSVALALTVLLFALCERLRPDSKPWTAFSIGAIAACLVLTRENAAVLLLPCAWFIARTAGRKKVVLAASGLALLLLPIGFRNQRLGGSFLPTASNVGVNLYIGNGPGADGFYVPLQSGRGHTDYEQEDARTLAEQELGRELTPSEVSAFFGSAACREIAADPSRFAGLLGRKLLLFLNEREYMDAVAFEAYQDESVILGTLGTFFRFGLIFPLAVLGLWRCARRNAFTLLLALGAGLLALSVLPFFVTGRFRMGVVPLLLPFAGAGVASLLEWRREARWKEAALPLSVAAGMAVVAFLPLRSSGDPLATTYTNLASELLRQESYERAEAWATRATEVEVENVDALYNLGLALKFQGRLQDSQRIFGESLKKGEAYAADVWAELGSLYAMQKDPQEARRAIARSLSLDPGNAAANYYLGLLSRQAGELEKAAEAYEIALQRRPRFSQARHNLAHVLLAQGRVADALRHLQDTVDRAPDFLPSLNLLGLLLSTHPDDALRDGPAALHHAERALELSREHDADVHATRAFALAELGRFEEALESLRNARMKGSEPARWDEAASLFRAGRPFRTDPTASPQDR
jgi:tetratricopeptide (TPR) repeat protein